VAFSGLYHSPPLEHPLSVLQMLWLNLIMDSFASLALASEPPVEAQLNRPPVNRSLSIITEQMWYNMIGQSLYQIVVLVILLFNRDDLPDCEDGSGPESRHYTLIFNTFVFMQLFNEFNARKLQGEMNIFTGIFSNALFLGISAFTFVIQGLIGHFGGVVFKVHEEGMTWKLWLLCIGLSCGPLVWQQVLNILKKSLSWRSQNVGKGLSNQMRVGASNNRMFSMIKNDMGRTERIINQATDHDKSHIVKRSLSRPLGKPSGGALIASEV